MGFSFNQCQYSLVNIVVDKDNTFLRTLNQVGHESIGIINLPIVEHTLLRLCVALVQSAEHLVYALVCFLLMLLHFQLMTCCYLLLYAKVVLLAFKSLLHNPFL